MKFQSQKNLIQIKNLKNQNLKKVEVFFLREHFQVEVNQILLSFQKKRKVLNESEIKNSFRNGIPKGSDKDMRMAMNSAFKVLEKIGGKKLVGNGKNLDPGTFWIRENIKYD